SSPPPFSLLLMCLLLFSHILFPLLFPPLSSPRFLLTSSPSLLSSLPLPFLLSPPYASLLISFLLLSPHVPSLSIRPPPLLCLSSYISLFLNLHLSSPLTPPLSV